MFYNIKYYQKDVPFSEKGTIVCGKTPQEAFEIFLIHEYDILKRGRKMYFYQFRDASIGIKYTDVASNKVIDLVVEIGDCKCNTEEDFSSSSLYLKK